LDEKTAFLIAFIHHATILKYKKRQGNNMNHDFIDALAEILECEPSGLSVDTIFRDHPNWDSLAVLTTMSMIDEKFEVLIKQDEFVRLKTVGDIIACIEAKKAG
jgi:acyl carrier protein